MGKYMRKAAKTTRDVAVTDLSLGVRTRAKTLALQRQATAAQPSASSYLQLRSRRLFKPPVRSEFKAGSRGYEEEEGVEEKNGENDAVYAENKDWANSDLTIEASFGENVLDIAGRERTTRESTPCSLIRDSDTIRTPGSTTRPTRSSETNRRIQNSHRIIATAVEMDEFFSKAEEEQQKQFVVKYNFDPVNDKPLPGRYEWKKLDP